MSNRYRALLALAFVAGIGVAELLHGWRSGPDGPPRTTSGAPGRAPLRDSTFHEWNRWVDARLAAERASVEYWRELSAGTAGRAALRERFARFAGRGAPGRVVGRRPLPPEPGIRVSELRLVADSLPAWRALLLEPVPRPVEPAPAILALHGADGTAESLLRDVDYHHGFAAALARCGFVVMAPIQIAATVRERETLYLKALSLGESLFELEIRTLRATVDVLRRRDDVDPEHVGAYGISLGGRQALLLGAVDERLSLVAVSGHFTDRATWLLGVDTSPRRLLPGAFMTLLEPSMDVLLDDLNSVALIAPRHFLVEVGRADPRYEMAVQEFEAVEALYGAAGAPERSTLVTFEGGHETSLAATLPVLTRWGFGGPDVADASRTTAPRSRPGPISLLRACRMAS